jgi:hypothetical protein
VGPRSVRIGAKLQQQLHHGRALHTNSELQWCLVIIVTALTLIQRR